MGKLAQFIFGIVLIIMGLLALLRVIPNISEVASYAWWSAGIIISAMSWR